MSALPQLLLLLSCAPAIAGALTCLSCVTRPASYSKMNYSELLRRLRYGGLILPHQTKGCAETDAISRPDFADGRKSYCQPQDGNIGSCVKLKGTFEDEVFVYRECWNLMWEQYRPMDPRKQNVCFHDGVDFVNTSSNILCFCDNDMCNAALKTHSLFAVLLFALLLPMFLR